MTHGKTHSITGYDTTGDEYYWIDAQIGFGASYGWAEICASYGVRTFIAGGEYFPRNGGWVRLTSEILARGLRSL